MGKPKFIKEIEKLEGKERAKLGKYYIRVYGQLDNKPMVELESLEIVVKELHKLEEENKKLKGLLKEHITTYDVHFDELIEENKKLKAELEEADKAKMNTLNGMSDLSSFGLEQVNKLEEENQKLKLHIEAKDKAYTALLKDYEEIKEDRDRMKAEIEQRLNAFRNR